MFVGGLETGGVKEDTLEGKEMGRGGGAKERDGKGSVLVEAVRVRRRNEEEQLAMLEGSAGQSKKRNGEAEDRNLNRFAFSDKIHCNPTIKIPEGTGGSFRRVQSQFQGSLRAHASKRSGYIPHVLRPSHAPVLPETTHEIQEIVKVCGVVGSFLLFVLLLMLM
jgi:hypothetical protein